MSRSTFALVFACMATLVCGCVERRFVVQTEPPGAQVFLNGEPLGATPVDYSYTYYGTYHFTLVKDGYETTHIEQRVAPPWWAYPPFDFIVEHLYPGEIEDVRRFQYSMQPMPQPNVADLIQQGEDLRARGRTLPPPTPPRYPELNPPDDQAQPSVPFVR